MNGTVTRRPTATLPALLALVVVLSPFAAPRRAAGQSAPVVNNPAPIVLKQGQSAEITLTGQSLAAVASVYIADPRGLDVALVKPEKPNDGEVRLKMTASAAADLGTRELRLVGPAGVSNPLRLHVGQYTVVQDKEPNNTAQQPQDVQLPATLVGRIDGSGDVDFYRFSATKGQKLLFDANASRLGSALDAILTVHDAAGKELPSQGEHHGADPMLIFDVPADGQYLLKVRDLEYRGGGNYDYRIDAGAIPYLEALLPMSGRPGQVVEAQAIGHNLAGGEKVTIDLSMAAPGRVPVRAKTSAGLSNEIPFEVTELPQAVEKEPNDSAETATAVPLPAEISGNMDRPSDEDFYKFHVPYRQAVDIDVLAGRFGSPVSPLLQLRNAKGDVIENNEGAPDADARIVRELDPGDYVVSVRDLTYAGGPGYAYRIKLQPAGSVPQDFAARFLPDAPRLSRGSHVVVWCEVNRLNGFRGEVTLTLEGLPAGVTAAPVMMAAPAPGSPNTSTSGYFSVSAAPDAALGVAPIKLRATATIGTQAVSRYAEPEVMGRTVGQAFLTVLDAAPFMVEALPLMSPQRIDQYGAEIQSLAARLSSPNPQFEAAMAAWDKEATASAAKPAWTVLDPLSFVAANGSTLDKLPDGSVLSGRAFPAKETYTVTTRTELKGITAIRLEALSNPTLPAKGPGTAPNGNFVLSEFKVNSIKGNEAPQPVALQKPSADFSQDNFGVAAAIDNDLNTGWAVSPQFGKDHVAVFETAKPLGDGTSTTLVFTLAHESIFAQHNIGRFRLSVATGDPATLPKGEGFPAPVLAILKTAPEQRSAEQKAQLAAYYRTIDPQTSADRNRLETLRTSVAALAEISRLEAALKAETPHLEAEQARWEQSVAGGGGWTALELSDLKSAAGARLTREADNSVFASGPADALDIYTAAAATQLKGITAIRFEVLPDPRLPGNGPGRAPDGTFLLTRLRLSVTPKAPAAPAMPAAPAAQPAAGAKPPATAPAAPPPAPPEPQEVTFRSAAATLEHQGQAVGGALDDKIETGWGVPPGIVGPATATFYTKAPVGGDGGSTLTFTLEQLSPHRSLGRFRIWATASPTPDAVPTLPAKIIADLAVPAGNRNEPQKKELAAYYRSIAPSLEPLRHRLSELKPAAPAFPLKVARGGSLTLPVPLVRAPNFKGDVTVTLEGYATGRDGPAPKPMSKNVKVTPANIVGDNTFGNVTLQAENSAEPGTHMVFLQATGKVGNDTVTQYSPVFPLTVTEK